MPSNAERKRENRMEKKPAATQRRRRVLRSLSAYVQCPFYRSGGERSITCQGAAPRTQTCMSFAHRVELEIWSLYYCCDIKRHHACPYGKLVEGLYDADGRYCPDRISKPLADAFETAKAQRAAYTAAHGLPPDPLDALPPDGA